MYELDSLVMVYETTSIRLQYVLWILELPDDRINTSILRLACSYNRSLLIRFRLFMLLLFENNYAEVGISLFSSEISLSTINFVLLFFVLLSVNNPFVE